MMSSLPLMLFVFAGLFSPGPNVVMLTASGARFGFRATLPHLLGVPVGTGLVAAAGALGVNAVFLALPTMKFAFQLGAALWILWLAWKTALAGRSGRVEDRGIPFSFVEAILFQAINPKVWAITLAAATGFSVGLAPHLEAGRLFAVFVSINLFVCIFWTSIGHLLSGLLNSDKNWKIFMTVMAVIMAGTVVLIFL